MDIGFGSADPVVQLATTFPEQVIMAVDVHTPGIGDLIDRIGTDEIPNVFVMEGDALELLPALPGQLSGVRSFFPDPWPKARHHKRRLVQPAVLDAMSNAVASGAFWHLATDWAEYAESMIETFAADERWSGGRDRSTCVAAIHPLRESCDS
jgi:tRNA (guanine-N7-)-methyltransferase